MFWATACKYHSILSAIQLVRIHITTCAFEATQRPMDFWQQQVIGRCPTAERPRYIRTAETIQIRCRMQLPNTATDTYCLERSKNVPDSFVIGRRFGATDTLHLRRTNTATDTPSISRNIKYTQTLADTESIGSTETASGIGHTSYQFSPTDSLRIRYSFRSPYIGLHTNSIRSIFGGTYTSLFPE
jgi:hypothetical protein